MSAGVVLARSTWWSCAIFSSPVIAATSVLALSRHAWVVKLRPAPVPPVPSPPATPVPVVPPATPVPAIAPVPVVPAALLPPVPGVGLLPPVPPPPAGLPLVPAVAPPAPLDWVPPPHEPVATSSANPAATEKLLNGYRMGRTLLRSRHLSHEL